MFMWLLLDKDFGYLGVYSSFEKASEARDGIFEYCNKHEKHCDPLGIIKLQVDKGFFEDELKIMEISHDNT